MLGVPAGTVKSRISRGRQALAGLLGPALGPARGNWDGATDVGVSSD